MIETDNNDIVIKDSLILVEKRDEIMELAGENFDKIYPVLEKINDDFIVIGDIKTMTFKFPKVLMKKIGLPSEIVENPYTYWKKIVHEKDLVKFREATLGLIKGEYDYNDIEYRVKDIRGKNIWLKHKGSIIRDKNGDPWLLISVISILGKQTSIDSITRLMKFTEFFEHFSEKLKNPKINELGMLIIGVDNFEEINQLHSRQYGDRVLKMLADIIQYSLPEDICLYRLDGDNFGIILEDVSKDKAEEIYLNIKSQLKKVQILKKEKINITISAGCAIFSREKITYQEIYKFTIYSLMYSKKTGKNKIVFFSNEVMENKIRHFEILYYLKQSIENNFKDFEIYYQPQVSAKTEELVGFEALLRWKCEKFGSVSPNEFIPFLEETGMINVVGKWVLEETTKFFKEWLKIYPKLKISINVSCIQLINEACILEFKKIIEKNKFPVENLIFEITESNTIKNIKVLKKICNKIQNIGIDIALDDFGVGYSSFGILKEVHIDMIKIDRSFVKDLLINPFDVTFIKFITEISKQRNIKVCLEGVERKEELEIVKSLEVDCIQGYYFGKPECKEETIRKYYKNLAK